MLYSIPFLDSFLEVSSSSVSQEIPKINARHAVVLDRLSGTILYGKNENELRKASIYGALNLYLDFINIFLELLQLFGKRND